MTSKPNRNGSYYWKCGKVVGQLAPYLSSVVAACDAASSMNATCFLSETPLFLFLEKEEKVPRSGTNKAERHSLGLSLERMVCRSARMECG